MSDREKERESQNERAKGMKNGDWVKSKSEGRGRRQGGDRESQARHK